MISFNSALKRVIWREICFWINIGNRNIKYLGESLQLPIDHSAIWVFASNVYN